MCSWESVASLRALVSRESGGRDTCWARMTWKAWRIVVPYVLFAGGRLFVVLRAAR